MKFWKKIVETNFALPTNIATLARKYLIQWRNLIGILEYCKYIYDVNVWSIFTKLS